MDRGFFFSYLPTWKIAVAVEQARRTVKRMPSIVDSATFFGVFMGGTQEYPLFGRSHLKADTGITVLLQHDSQRIQFHTELT